MSTPTAAGPTITAAKYTSQTESPIAKFFISGGITLVFEGAAGGHYLEMLKILKQTSNDSYLTITRRMTAHKGVIGILDGFVPWGAAQCAIKGSSFGFGQAASRQLLEAVPLSDGKKTILSGGFGGMFQGIVMSPMLLLKTRVMTDPRFRTSGGMSETAVQSFKLGAELVRNEGVTSLGKGMGVFAGKRFADWTTRFGFVVLVENAVKRDAQEKLPMRKQMMCALGGGTLSALVTIPIDVLVATIQQANKAGKHVSILQLYREKLASGGVNDLVQLSTRGLFARVAHVALTTLMMKTVSSWVFQQWRQMRD